MLQAFRLDEIFADLAKTVGPGLVAGINRRGNLTYRRAFGRANIGDGAPNEPRTRMRIGSSTKQFTCFSVLLLAEDGLLSIDDDIRKHLPELPEYSKTVAIRHLMSNTSGLRCYLDLIGILAGMERRVPAPLPTTLQLRQSSVNFSPGSRFLYCNGGFLLLSLLIERISGMPFAQFLQERIFQPLGMSRTALEPDDMKLLEETATLHQRQPDGSYHRGTIGVPLTGDGAIISDVADMLTWLAHMDAPVLGNAQTWKTFLSAGTESDHGYGFGLMHRRYRGVATVQHGGTVFGGRCQLLKVPNHAIDIVMMTNASDVLPADWTDRVLDVLLEGELGPPLQKTTADRAHLLTGTYYSADSGDAVTIITKEGHAFLDGENGEQPLYDAEAGGVQTNAVSLGITLTPNASPSNGGVSSLELSQGGFSTELRRVNASESAYYLTPFAGEYTNADCDARATVASGASPTLSICSPYGSAQYRLEHLQGDSWYARLQHTWLPMKIRVEFSDSSFALSSERTKRLEFKRC